MVEVFEWDCDCGKKIVAVNKAQFDYCKKLHVESCEKKKNKGETNV